MSKRIWKWVSKWCAITQRNTNVAVDGATMAEHCDPFRRSMLPIVSSVLRYKQSIHSSTRQQNWLLFKLCLQSKFLLSIFSSLMKTITLFRALRENKAARKPGRARGPGSGQGQTKSSLRKQGRAWVCSWKLDWLLAKLKLGSVRVLGRE